MFPCLGFEVRTLRRPPTTMIGQLADSAKSHDSSTPAAPAQKRLSKVIFTRGPREGYDW
jgi:hypothetical protein